MSERDRQEDFDIQDPGISAPPKTSFAGEVDSWEAELVPFDIQEPGNPSPPKTSLAGDVEDWDGTK